MELLDQQLTQRQQTMCTHNKTLLIGFLIQTGQITQVVNKSQSQRKTNWIQIKTKAKMINWVAIEPKANNRKSLANISTKQDLEMPSCWRTCLLSYLRFLLCVQTKKPQLLQTVHPIIRLYHPRLLWRSLVIRPGPILLALHRPIGKQK